MSWCFSSHWTRFGGVSLARAGHNLFFANCWRLCVAAALLFVAPIFICACKAFVASLQHFLVTQLSAKAVACCEVMMLVAGHVVLVGDQLLGCPKILWLLSWPG